MDISSLSGLFKSSLCFCSVMCAFRWSDLSLARDEQNIPGKWLTQNNTQAQDGWMTDWQSE